MQVCNTPDAMERSPCGGNMIRSVVALAIATLFLITTLSRQVGHEVPRPLTEKCKGELCSLPTSLHQGTTDLLEAFG